MNRPSNRRGRSLAIAALTALTLAGVAGCSSDSDGGPSDTVAGASVDTADEPTQTAPVADDTDSGSSDTTNADDGVDESAGSAECGGLTAAAITSAVGAGDFDSADDVSFDEATTCVFTNSMNVYGVSVTKESTSTYLAGDLDGATIDDALASLESVLTFAIGEPTVTRTDVGGNAAVVVTGTSTIGDPAGKAATVVDGVVVIVEADGGIELAADPAGFEPIVTNLLALATSS